MCSCHECECDILHCHESTVWRASTGNTTVTSWKGLGVCDLSRAIKLERAGESLEVAVGKLRLSSCFC